VPGSVPKASSCRCRFGYVTDAGGSPMDPEFEPAADYVPFGNTSHTLMSFFASPAGGSHTDPYTYTLSLPWTDFQVVDQCYAQGTCFAPIWRRWCSG
jgi:hypothetical protein